MDLVRIYSLAAVSFIYDPGPGDPLITLEPPGISTYSSSELSSDS